MKLPYMPFYPNDYLSDKLVSALSAAAQGCYIRILCHLWNGNEPFLPNDTQKLARIVGFPHDEFLNYWHEIQSEGFEILQITDDGKKVTQKRLYKEWLKAQDKSETMSDVAKRRWQKEKDANTVQTHKPKHSQSNDNQNQNQNQIQNQNLDSEPEPEPEPKETETGAENAPALAVSTVDNSMRNCPSKQIIALYHEILPELPQVREWAETSRRMLVLRWREKKERQNLDWWREYFLKVKASDFLTGKTQGRNGPFYADLEWLVRPTNLAKVVNDKYINRKQKDIYTSAAEKGYDKCMEEFNEQFGLFENSKGGCDSGQSKGLEAVLRPDESGGRNIGDTT